MDNVSVPFISSDPDEKYAAKVIGFAGSFLSFAEHLEIQAKDAEKYQIPFDKDSFTEDMKECVKERDGGVCFIHGVAANNTELAWIVFPDLAHLAHIPAPGGGTFSVDVTENHMNFHNIITLNEVLLAPFLENKFGIDVEDDYKIIIFQDFPGSERLAANPRLPATSIEALNDSSRVYLRENFRYCFGVNLMGGDIREDYPDLGEDYFEEIAEHGFRSPTNEKWQTPLGREILEYYKDELPPAFLDLLQ